jgi:hypothetical protein
MIARNRLARAATAWMLAVYWRLKLRYRIKDA